MSNDIALKAKLADIIAEHDAKQEHAEATVSAFENAQAIVDANSCILGTFSGVQIDTGRGLHVTTIKDSITKSAWRHVYENFHIKRLASANDKQRFTAFFEKPIEFNIENIRDVYGDYIRDPYGNILRGLAEVFCDLDQAYKSHDKVKIGVKGLPNRIIVGGFKNYTNWGRDRIQNVLNALATYQQIPLVDYNELVALEEDGKSMLVEREYTNYKGEKVISPARGVELKLYKNGNGHLHFTADTAKDINRALAEYYGDVLADGYEEKPTEKRASTEVSKDLQYYPTPKKIVDFILDYYHIPKTAKVLEPSCGCGRLLDGLKEKGVEDVFGIEVNAERARECRSKGYNVMTSNFLEAIPVQEFDYVFMNTPFYGKHYHKHIEHAKKFLKDDGVLISILPVTARYDHGLIEKGDWRDLPVGSFSESGVNVNTTILMQRMDRL